MQNMIKYIAYMPVLFLALAALGCGTETLPVGPAQAADVAGDVANDAAGTDSAGGAAGDADGALDTTGAGGGATDAGSAGADMSAEDAGVAESDILDPCKACTADQKCVAGKCVGEDPCDGKCAEGQICSEGQCIEKPKPCGGPCKTGEVCNITANGGKGVCMTPTCKLPSVWGPHLQKVAMMTLLPAAKGCDLDGDGVPNNALGAIAALVGKSFEDTFKNGAVIMILETPTWPVGGTSFDINVLQGELATSSSDCDVVNSNCTYLIKPSSYDPVTPGTGLCAPVSVFNGVKVTGGKLSAGGPKQEFQMVLGLAGIGFKVPVKGATLTADVSGKTGWKTLTNGQLCGVVLKEDLEAAVDKVPDAELQPVGGKAGVKTLLNTLVIPDVDTTGDGKNDGISAALTLTGISAAVAGLAKAP